MKNLIRSSIARTLAVALLSFPLAGSARGEEWTDAQGKTFKADAIGTLGPFAIFSEKPTVGRCLPVQALPLTELARFTTTVKNSAPHAADWAQATGTLTAELRGHLEKVEQQKLVPYSVDGRPEPAVVVVLFLNKEAGDTWKLFWGSMEPMGKLGRLAPGLVECVGYGVNHGRTTWLDQVKDAPAPWSLVKLDDQPLIKTLDIFVPRSGYRAVAFSRDGVPLFGTINPDENEVQEFWKKVGGFVAMLEPGNPFSWRPRAYLRTAQQIAAHPTGRVEPELIGHAIRPGSLARLNLHAFDATLKISSEGVVSDVANLKSEATLPPKLHDALITTLKKAVFVPALENGQPIESEFIYHFRDESAVAQ